MNPMNCKKYLTQINRKRINHEGFTLIEVLMVILLLAILALLAITQFTNFTVDTKNATTKGNLQILRRGIATQNAQMRVRCNVVNTS